MNVKKIAAIFTAAAMTVGLNVSAFADAAPEVIANLTRLSETGNFEAKTAASEASIAVEVGDEVKVTYSADASSSPDITINGADIFDGTAPDTTSAITDVEVTFTVTADEAGEKLTLAVTDATVTKVEVGDVTVTGSPIAAGEIKKGVPAASIAVQANDIVTVTYTTAAADTADMAITVNGAEPDAALTAGTSAQTAAFTMTAAASKIDVTVANATVTGVKVERPAAAAPPEGDGATAPTITVPSSEQTLTLAANTWNDGEDHRNYQGSISLFSGASKESVEAMTENVSVKVNLKNISVADGSKLNIMLIVQSTGDPENSGAGAVWQSVCDKNFGSGNTVTLSATAASIIAKATDSVGTYSLLIAFGTSTDDAAITSAPTIKFTFGDETSVPEETTTAAPAAPSNNGGWVAATPSGDSSSSAAASTTAAPAEVVTAANGEAVEAPKDVIPDGAALEVEEQTKEEAVKVVEAVKATGANKEVVETVKKAVGDGKAAVVEISLVKNSAEVQPNGTVKVTLNVPAVLKDAAKVYVYRVEADGTFTNVNAELKDGKVTFSTKHFSTYIFTSEPLTGDAVKTEAEANKADQNQNTGVAFVLIPAALAAAGVVASKKRK